MIRTMAPPSIPVFLKNAGIGIHRGPLPPQLISVDVYYKFPIIVGFHVLGKETACKDAIDLTIEYIEPVEGPQIVSFDVYYTTPLHIPPQLEIELEVPSEESEECGIISFYAQIS